MNALQADLIVGRGIVPSDQSASRDSAVFPVRLDLNNGACLGHNTESREACLVLVDCPAWILESHNQS